MKILKFCFPVRGIDNILFFRKNVCFSMQYKMLLNCVLSSLIMSVFVHHNNLLKLSKSENISVKLRKDIKYSTKKLYKQKGTGCARLGSKRSPLLKGGASLFSCSGKHKKIKYLKKGSTSIIFYILINKRAYLTVVLMYMPCHRIGSFGLYWTRLLKLFGATHVNSCVVSFYRVQSFFKKVLFYEKNLNLNAKYIFVII